MQLLHTPPVASAVFDEPNLVSFAGLVPVMALARRAGLGELADQWLSVPTDKGANAGAKVASLVAGMAAGADSIDDVGVLRHGAMDKVWTVPSFVDTREVSEFPTMRGTASWDLPVELSRTSTRRMQ